jgi:hypothetical protein
MLIYGVSYSLLILAEAGSYVTKQLHPLLARQSVPKYMWLPERDLNPEPLDMSSWLNKAPRLVSTSPLVGTIFISYTCIKIIVVISYTSVFIFYWISEIQVLVFPYNFLMFSDLIEISSISLFNYKLSSFHALSFVFVFIGACDKCQGDFLCGQVGLSCGYQNCTATIHASCHVDSSSDFYCAMHFL